MSWDVNAFKEKLEDQHTFPGNYIFKFIVPSESIDQVKSLWPGGKISIKASSKGKYTSVTIEGHMDSSDDVISVYQKAHEIEGCIAL